MYRWDIQYSGRALRPHRTISGTMVVHAGKVYTAMQRAAQHIADKEGIVTALAVRATRLALLKPRTASGVMHVRGASGKPDAIDTKLANALNEIAAKELAT